MINVINSLSFIRGVYRKKKIKYIFITYSEARATQENSYFKDKGKRKKLEKKKKNQSSSKGSKFSGSALVKLFIRLPYNYVFKHIQVLVTSTSPWLLSIFQDCLKPQY